MTFATRLPIVSATALILGTSVAYADVTSQDIWADWKAYMSGLGYTLSGTENQSGNTLTVTDVTMSMVISDPSGDGSFDIVMPEVVFSDLSDGRVQIALPAVSAMNVTGEAEGEVFSGTMEYRQTGLEMFASGDADNIQYDYSAASIGLSLTELKFDNEVIGRDAARVDVEFANLNGTSSVQAGELRQYDQNLTAEKMNLDFFFIDAADASASVKYDATLNDLTLSGKGALPNLDTTTGDMNAMLEAGFAFSSTMAFASGNSSIVAQDPEGGGSFTSASQGGTLDVTMSSGGLVYNVGQKDVSIDVLTNEFPVPISLKAAETGGRLAMPVMKSDEAQDFGFAFNLTDFTISELLWGMFDPAGRLPRDPATIALDLTGMAKLLVDYLDPAVAEDLENADEFPAEVETLSLNNLILSVAGARLTGNGAFSFDNSTPSAAFGGIPQPEGAVNLLLEGGNGLMDKLVNMGLLPQDQAAGARLMMGLFARPGDGPDTLVSTIEVNSEGHVLANGQRIQ